MAARIPLELHEVPSGTKVLDWTVPDEWNIRDAYIATSGGRRVVDFGESNLHVVSYSEPVREDMTLEDLRPHLHVHAERPDWIPYRTSYYTRSWGFCLSQNQLEALEDGTYRVVIDSTLAPGSLTYGECFLAGESDDEILLTTHVCHPSLANDNVSGIVCSRRSEPRSPSSRGGTRTGCSSFPERSDPLPGSRGTRTGSRRRRPRGRVRRRLRGPELQAKPPRGLPVDRAGAHVVGRGGGRILDFVPWGWDERQFNSPGFDIPVGCLTRSLEGEFPEYHSSADDLDLISADRLEEALEAALEILDVLEHDRTYRNLSPKGEPQLGKRGLYRGLGGPDPGTEQLAILWVLNQSDGSTPCST